MSRKYFTLGNESRVSLGCSKQRNFIVIVSSKVVYSSNPELRGAYSDVLFSNSDHHNKNHKDSFV